MAVMAEHGDPAGLDLRDYVKAVERQLTELVGRQREVLLRAIDECEGNKEPIEACGLVDCQPLRRYRQAVAEAVRVLAESRRSFKSRPLEQLRLQLEQVLADDRGSRSDK